MLIEEFSYDIDRAERDRAALVGQRELDGPGVDFTHEQRREAAVLRKAEPWFGAAHDAYGRVWTGAATDADFDASAPFFYGRWDVGAEEHASEREQTNEGAADIYASRGAFHPEAARTALTAWDVPALVLAGEVDGGPLPRVAADIAELFPRAELAVQPDAGHYPWLDDPRGFTRTVEAFLTQGRGGPTI
ncbi:alpha/beta fold hydrolase [Streptomyces sp. NPDC088846]|uniref:alpha/beta fold hydrolase n=1 Tax=Streptomyces sp. NPDC088846 TaxID=3365908 RepID=UPI0038249368